MMDINRGIWSKQQIWLEMGNNLIEGVIHKDIVIP